MSGTRSHRHCASPVCLFFRLNVFIKRTARRRVGRAYHILCFYRNVFSFFFGCINRLHCVIHRHVPTSNHLPPGCFTPLDNRFIHCFFKATLHRHLYRFINSLLNTILALSLGRLLPAFLLFDINKFLSSVLRNRFLPAALFSSIHFATLAKSRITESLATFNSPKISKMLSLVQKNFPFHVCFSPASSAPVSQGPSTSDHLHM